MKVLQRFLLAFFLLSCGIAYAVPARSVAHQYTQPDGTKVTLRPVGDEFFHFFLTEDDQMVFGTEEGYFFAEPDAQGAPRASKVLAADPKKRTAAQSAFVSSINAKALRAGATKVAKAQRAKATVKKESSPFRAPRKAIGNDWSSKGVGLFPDAQPITGSPHLCAILVQFSDCSFTVPNASTYFNNFANQEGFNDPGKNFSGELTYGDGSSSNLTPIGSARDFFTESSNGLFTPIFDVYGPVTLPNPMSYYGGNTSTQQGTDARPHYMAIHAMDILNSSVDFSKYDLDGDGELDLVYIIFAGWGEASGGPANNVWPHAWYVKDGGGVSKYYDGKLLNHYACSGELFWQQTGTNSYYVADGIGTFCHEFSHVLGLPDEYDTDYGTAYKQGLTPGEYSLMDGGPYNVESRRPATHSIFQRNALGWADIEVIEPGKGMDLELEHVLTSHKGYAIETGNKNEFYLLENRQLNRWDSGLPGHGLCLWHITYNSTNWRDNQPNNSASLQGINLVSANGTPTTTSGRPFPGTSNVSSYTPKTNSGTNLNVPITQITESNGKISFKVNGGTVTKPSVSIDGAALSGTEVSHNGAATLTFSAPTGHTIKYMYMTNSDLSDELTYSAPITVSESTDFQVWAVRNADGMVSETVDFHITINPAQTEPDPQTPTEEGSSVVFDFTLENNPWGFPVGSTNKAKDEASFSHNGYTIKVAAGGNNGYYLSTDNKYLLYGKSGAYIELPAFTKAVEKIVVSAGSSSASTNVSQNIFVGNTTVSTACTNSQTDATFIIKSDAREVGTIYTLKVTNAYNAQISKITVHFVGEGGDEPETPTETVAAPTFTPAAGEVEAGTTVEITTATEGAAIYYTLDGSTPSAESTAYTAAISVNEAVTIKAIAVKDGMLDSEVAEAAYTIKATEPVDPGEQPLEVTFDFTGETAYGMTLLSGNANTYNDSPYVCTQYNVTMTLTGNTRWWSASPNQLRFYVGSSFTLVAPTGYKIANVAFTGMTATNWNMPNTTGKDAQLSYSTTITSKNTSIQKVTVTLVADEGGSTDPQPTEAVATPTFSPEAGEVEAGTTVAIATATEGAAIYYTLDGSTPSAESTAYTAAISVNEAVTIKAIAVKDGMLDSEVAEAAYTIKATDPVDPQDPEDVTSFRIVFSDDTSDSSSDLNATGYVAECEEGADIATFNECTKVYKGKYGLKFSTGSVDGQLTLAINEAYQKNISKVVINAKNYGSDAAKLAVNGGTAQELATDAADYTFNLDGSVLTSITINATKRLYVKSITFFVGEGTDPVDPQDPEPDHGAEKLYLRGTMNNWPAADATEITNVDDTYSFEVSSEFDIAFKLSTTNGADWDAFNAGVIGIADFNDNVALDTDYTLTSGVGSNIKVAAGSYTVTVTYANEAYTLRVEGEPYIAPVESITTLYLRGTMNSWPGTAEDTIALTAEDGVYTYDVESDSDIIFKVSSKNGEGWDAFNSAVIGLAEDNQDYTIDADTDYTLVEGKKGNTKIAAGSYTLTITQAEGNVFTLRATTKQTDPQDPEDPQPGEQPLVVTFDFTGETAYGMTLLSGTTSEYNADPYTCTQDNVTMTLNGGTRWWDASTHELRFYAGSSFTLTAPTGYKIADVAFTGMTDKNWNKPTLTGKDAQLVYSTSITKGNTAIQTVTVTLVADSGSTEPDPEDPENPQDPTVTEPTVPDFDEIELDNVTFDFTGESAYGMVLHSTTNESGSYNPAEGYDCEEADVTMSLYGQNRWWQASSANELRFHKDSYFVLTPADGYVIKDVTLQGSTASKWNEPEFNDDGTVKVATKVSSGNTAIKGVKVTLMAIPTFSVDNFAFHHASDKSVSLTCTISHSNAQHVALYQVWVVKTGTVASNGIRRAEAQEVLVGSATVSGEAISGSTVDVTVPVDGLAADSGIHTVVVRTHAVLADASKVYSTAWAEGDVNGSTGEQSHSIDTSKDDVTGIEDIISDASAAEYFNLQGVRVAQPQPGNVYILRSGSKTTKVLVK